MITAVVLGCAGTASSAPNALVSRARRIGVGTDMEQLLSFESPVARFPNDSGRDPFRSGVGPKCGAVPQPPFARNNSSVRCLASLALSS